MKTYKGLLAVAAVLARGALQAAEDAKAEAANAKARVEAAQKVYKGMIARRNSDPSGGAAGLAWFEQLNRWSLRWMGAQCDLSTKKADKVAAVEAHLKRMREWEKNAKAMAKKGSVIAPYEVSAVTFYRLDAEKLLRKAKKK
jgi:hypothetical protein